MHTGNCTKRGFLQLRAAAGMPRQRLFLKYVKSAFQDVVNQPFAATLVACIDCPIEVTAWLLLMPQVVIRLQ